MRIPRSDASGGPRATPVCAEARALLRATPEGTSNALSVPGGIAMPVITTHDSPEPEPSRQEVIYSGEDRRVGPDRRRAAVPDDRVTTTTLTGGSSVELIGGGVAIVLAIIGL